MLGILGVNIDITERKLAEKALHDSLQTSADIVASIPSGLLIWQQGRNTTRSLTRFGGTRNSCWIKTPANC